jgi:hypothetical protein
MAALFDSSQSVRFDLGSGAVRSAGSDERLLLISAASLMDLALSAPPEAVEALGRALGGAVGKRAAARLRTPGAAESSIDDFVTQLAGEVALAGVGILSVERWGRALVVVLEDSPLVGTLVAPFVGAAIEASTGRKVAAALLSRDQQKARVLVSSERAVERVRGWIDSGVAWGEAITRLHGGAS